MLRILLALIVLFPCLVLGQTTQDPNNPNNQNNTTSGAQGNEDTTPENITITFPEIVIDTQAIVDQLDAIATNTAPDPSAENRRDGYQYDSVNLQHADLGAQDSMAGSTFWMAVFAGIGLAISGWGIYLLFQNLGLTTKMIRQNRAYMTSRGIALKNPNPGEDEIPIAWEIENSGETPALNVRSVFTGRLINIVETSNPGLAAFPELPVADVPPSSLGKGGSTTWYGDLSQLEIDQASENREVCKYVIIAVIEYEDIHGDVYRTRIAKCARFDYPPIPEGEDDVFIDRDYASGIKWSAFSTAHNTEGKDWA